MSKLPQLNLRIPTEYQGIVRQVAERLRERDAASFAANLTAWLQDNSDLPTAPATLVLDDLAKRIEALEAWRQTFGGATTENPFTQPPGPPVSEWPTGPHRVDEAVLEDADTWKRETGATWNFIAQRLGFEAGGDALRKAVDRWKRKGKAA